MASHLSMECHRPVIGFGGRRLANRIASTQPNLSTHRPNICLCLSVARMQCMVLVTTDQYLPPTSRPNCEIGTSTKASDCRTAIWTWCFKHRCVKTISLAPAACSIREAQATWSAPASETYTHATTDLSLSLGPALRPSSHTVLTPPQNAETDLKVAITTLTLSCMTTLSCVELHHNIPHYISTSDLMILLHIIVYGLILYSYYIIVYNVYLTLTLPYTIYNITLPCIILCLPYSTLAYLIVYYLILRHTVLP